MNIILSAFFWVSVYLVLVIPILWWTYRPEQKQITANLGEVRH